MFRRARLSVKPNVKPGIGSRGSTTSTAQRGAEVPRLPEPATASAPNPAEPTDVPLVDFGRTEPQEKASRSSDEKTDGKNNVEKPSKPSAAVSQRRKRVSSTSSLDKPSISVSSEPHPLPAVNQEIPQPNPMPTKEKQPCSDRYRIYKAQKLREMLKEELRKEKKQWKNKYAINESQKPPDRSKMTMRDFIYYLPNNNPMISSLEQEKKTEKSSTPVQTRELESKTTPDAEENEEIEEESDDGPLLVPRVKVAEDGSIILDEESLTVEVLRTKGPCVVEENDPIFERGSTTTYSSFRKNYYSKPWSNKETDMFFLAISMVGTDFSMIGQLFPHRARIEIKNKFKREEKANGWRIDKAFQEKRPFDFDFFAHLLQKVLAEEEKRKQKSVKNHNSKEKKSSKPRKKVKGKKVVSKEVNDGPNESMSTHVSDREGLQKDVQTVEEQQPSLAFSEQDSGQITLESDLNQKKRQRRNQNETDEQVRNLSGSATVQSSHSKGGKHKSKCESLRPEVNDSECNREQKLSCLQDTDDIVDLLSSEKVEKRTDPILSSSNQQDATVATECSESSTSNLPSSEVGARTLSEVNNAESRCTKERNVDLKNKLLETDQTENIKPIVRGRFQRPKPNLSRAVGKKPVISQGKTDSENKSSHPETSVEKPHMEKDKMNKMDSLGMENSEKENTEAETISKEKICLQEDTQLKAFRHSRLMRGQLRRPKPNVGKVAERKEILTSEEKIEPSEEKKENESCIDRDIPEQMEDQSYKNYDCGDTTSQPENEDASFQNVQPQEPKMLYECLSVQENNEANIVKQAPIVRTQFQKPKPNIRRGTGRRELSLREEVPENIIASGEKESALKEIARLPHEKVLVEANTTKEMDKDLKDTIENVPEMINIAVDMESGFKETGRVISPKENVSEVVDVLEEIETDLEETGREISPREKTSEEVKTVSEEEKCLKKTRRETSRRKKIPKMIVASEEREPSFEETGREISPQEKASEEVKTVGEIKKSLKKTEREISRRKKIPEMIVASEEREPDLEETGREISPQEKALEKVKTVGEMKKSLKKTEREISQRNKIPEMIVASEKRKPDLEETGGEISPQEKASEEVKTVGEIKKSLKKTEREIFPRRKVPEMIAASEEIEQDLEETGRGKTSPREKAPEEVKTVGEVETGLEESRVEVSPGKKIPEMTVASEERETHLEETGRGEISPWEKAPEEVKIVGKVETDLEETEGEISPREKVLEEVSAIEEREIDLKETGKENIFLMDKLSGKMTIFEEMEDLKDTGAEIFLRERGSEEMSATEETVADLKNTAKIDTAPRKSEPEEDGSSRQTETNLIQSSSDHCSHMPPPDIQNISSDMLLTLHTSVEEERNSEKEVSSQLSESKTSLQTSEVGITEDQGIQSPDGPEQFSYTNLSKSLPQEQNPFEVKTAPFVRSRFKRPKPNLARAALRRENTDTGKYIPEKKLETDKMETLTIQQNSEETNNHPSQDDVGSLMTPRERVESGHKEEKDVISPCIQTENSVSYSHSGEPKEESQFMQAQENDLVASAGACNINTFQEEMKDSGIQAQPMRRRLQRPRPNIRKIEKRQLVEKGDTKDIIKEEKPVLSTDGTEKFLAVPNSQIGTEIEVVSTKVSECRINENQSHVVLVENLHVNKLNILDEKIRYEHKTYAPSPTQLVRRQSQKAKPNLRMAHSKRKEPEPEKDMADHSEARKPEGNLLQQGDSDIQFLPKKKTKLLTSLEISARKDYIGPKEPVLAKKDAQSEELGPLGSATKETSGDNSVSSIIKEQYLSKPASCPRLLKEPNYSKIALDRRTAISSASECEIGHNERKIHRKSKPNVTKGRASKRNRGKSSKKEPRASKSVLVTLRASQEEEDDDDEDFASDYEEESYHLAPEEVNKAPVFVPLGLRSPEPVATQIEETMEELEITVNVPDTTCIDTVEHHFSNTDVTTQEMKQEENLSALSITHSEFPPLRPHSTKDWLQGKKSRECGFFPLLVPSARSADEMTTGEHNQDETGTNDGSTEAAIALLTMGDLVLQSEISTEQGDGIGVLPEVHSKDNIHIPSSPGDRKHSITHECQELSLPVISVSPASLEENKIVLEEQSTTREESGLMEKVKENAVPARNTVSKVTNNLRIRSRFPKPKPNLTRILGTKRLVAHREVPSLFVTKGQEVEIQTETEKNIIKETDSEDKNLGSIITAEKKEQSKLACAHGMEGTRISQEANLTERNESQEERSEEVQRLSVVSAETVPHLLGLDRGLGEPLTERSIEDSVLTLREPECPPTSMSEVQQENVISPQDIAVNLVANVHQDGEDEQAFILTLVEIPTNAVEEFTNTATQLMPNPFLPAPILVKSVNKEERGDMSMSFPVTSIGQDNICLYNSGRDDSENPAADLDFISRKRVHCRLEDSNCVSPAKKCSLTSRHDYREYTSEVCSKELINVFEETGEPYKEQNIFPTSGSTNITPDPQKEQLEPTLQNIGTTFLDKTDTQKERSTPQSPQDGMIVLDKEERTIAASKSEQVDSRTSSLKTPLSRPGRRPLGFLSLICSKNSLESEPTQVHSKKRLKPVIPVSRKNLKRSNPPKENQKKPQESSDPLASSSVVNTQSENTDSLTAQVPCDLPLLKEECKSSQNQTSEEELTTISEYFFNDIFIEVDETE
ncbi:transcription factor TFIIIB component B'' homolog [Orycteropus afer afer]|uniref:Transcription factor TFIIIB component B'' homolog n=1 Tax=Orycteropus afer afer TaxID=1230840 RepID=A0A8B7A0S7_ORYAF|nr:transcription factor TFIIIB component B'' homolog [Orycteropus afer afer]